MVEGIGLLQGKSLADILKAGDLIPNIDEETLKSRTHKTQQVLGFDPDESISKVFKSEKVYYDLQRLRENPPEIVR